ncbi:MAG: hypothetical protein HC936_14090 [Leptolyngbyaceae cyanobacterium SU_3_3]|nr:hypothetical protein [Leptolyngbyaceae cyanobacterium SU_3_3]
MANIRINANQWNSLSEDGKHQIIQIYRNTGLLKGDDNVVPDSGVPLVENIEFPIPPKVCRIACDATATAAACAVLAPELIAACIAGAEIARQACRDAC